MNMRFGLYEVGTDVARTRTPRSAVKTYAEIIKAQAISPALLKQFPPE